MSDEAEDELGPYGAEDLNYADEWKGNYNQNQEPKEETIETTETKTSEESICKEDKQILIDTEGPKESESCHHEVENEVNEVTRNETHNSSEEIKTVDKSEGDQVVDAKIGNEGDGNDGGTEQDQPEEDAIKSETSDKMDDQGMNNVTNEARIEAKGFEQNLRTIEENPKELNDNAIENSGLDENSNPSEEKSTPNDNKVEEVTNTGEEVVNTQEEVTLTTEKSSESHDQNQNDIIVNSE